MVKNITNIFIKILTVILVIMLLNTTISHAGIWDTIIDGGNEFIETGKNSDSNVDNAKIKETSSDIFNVLFVIGIILIIIVGVVLGIQFMTSSVEGKAKIKESFIPYFAGSIVILGAFGIWKIMISIFSQI